MMTSRYTVDQKKEILAKYQQLRAAGKKVEEAIKEVGVTYMTIRIWEGKVKPNTKKIECTCEWMQRALVAEEKLQQLKAQL